MTCQPFQLPDGTTGIACGRFKRETCACGRNATLLCDWKVKRKGSGTCDKPLCSRCTFQPAPDKDLCPAHAEEWKGRLL